MSPPPAARPPSPGTASVGAAAALAGTAAGAAGLAVSELLAGFVPGIPSLAIEVGTLVIALQPAGAKDLVVRLFGTNDKAALDVAVVVVALILSAVGGMVARRKLRRGAWIFVAGGLLGFAAAALDPLVSPVLGAASAVASTAVALVALRFALAAVAPVPAASPGGLAGATAMPDWDRRRFVLRAGALLALAAAGGAVGRLALQRQQPAAARAAVPTTLPLSADTAAPLGADQSLSAPGITPIVVPNGDFYRIDTRLIVPQVDAASWTLSVIGMIDHPLTFRYADLLGMPLFEQYVTLQCVSDPVGGLLVGNALWTGVRLKDVLAQAGVHAGATQIVGRSVDGFTVGFPTAWALDPAREPMIALGMNRVPLPAEHGYPARLIVPGLYGYVSATKWLSQVELTTREAFDAYWVRLGWAKDGPILTQSRIDNPQDGDILHPGQLVVDGLAWAPDRGIERVEVRVDNGPWMTALLSRAISRATWVQWMVRWDAMPGDHSIEVRATDGTGVVQTAEQTDPAPDGARGHHTIYVSVRS
jgi:DMSO/TMAO reductase YedYZ molybdopterin-dependent catalytic subunit